MRPLFASFVLLIATSCASDSRGEEIERLEMRLSGWSSLEVVIDAGGNGTYKDSEPHPDGTTGGFKLTRAELFELLAELQPYRKQAVPFSEESAMRFIERACPKGVPEVTDAGAFYIRWQSANDDVHYLADFGCDYERLADRNGQLREIVKGLPIPSVR
ncbi:hypothetical protein D2V17_00940 [Aurantiacibacter xanthus]|uniref:Uncharacterized protein n=1 Tax=Aurantiacibacter xanthus TaxID=1784712 RepID=A0A3A1PGA6_9SPHN|nr:hypothetical protein [Aurantiacibacter xanthus]RIV92859.1 hypothetical protein D2V17_00940 [Aurantiacibacter xanthus]